RRQLTWDGSRYLVEGRPLRSFHFSGYSPDKPYVLSGHLGNAPQILLSKHPVLARLCKNYAERLAGAGFHEFKDIHYKFGNTDTGLVLDARIRSIYRREFLDCEQRKERIAIPDPFTAESADNFERWLASPRPDGRIPRYLRGIW